MSASLFDVSRSTRSFALGQLQMQSCVRHAQGRHSQSSSAGLQRFGVRLMLGVAVVLGSSATSWAQQGLSFEEEKDRLTIRIDESPVAQFIFADEQVLRPYFANLRTAKAQRISRPHPPQTPDDATDHETMHPGVWLGFGDINGHDFWRNKGKIEHVAFVETPKVEQGQISFAQEARLLDQAGNEMGRMINRCVVSLHDDGWMLTWSATFKAGNQPLVFGDQEEMGFGARVVQQLTEKSGGTIVSSAGKIGAASAWGQEATWCDVSGVVDGELLGLTLIAASKNFRRSWWHTRDYGLMVANPFGRAAMKQGDKSEVVVAAGEELVIAFAAVVHTGYSFAPSTFVQKLEF